MCDYWDRIAQAERRRQCALVECVKLTDAHLDHTPLGSWAKHARTHKHKHTPLLGGKPTQPTRTRKRIVDRRVFPRRFIPIVHTGRSALHCSVIVLIVIVEALLTPSLTHWVFHLLWASHERQGTQTAKSWHEATGRRLHSILHWFKT